MTRARLECSNTDHTGELPRILHRRGSGLQASTPRHPDNEDVRPAECSGSRCDFDLAIADVHLGRP
jgi:hypothetical protein